MMQTDIKATHLDANGTAYSSSTRVKGYSISPGGTAGEVYFYDTASNTATGTIRLTLNVSTNQSLDSLALPGEGIKFDNGVYCTFPASTHLTVYYG